MEGYLIDTNIISKYLTEDLPEIGLDFLDKIVDKTPVFSIISKIELLCWKSDDNTILHIKNFINESIVVNLSDEVIDCCVELRKYKKIKTPDAIVAATAIVNNFILLTDNIKDFENIKGLKIINPNNL